MYPETAPGRTMGTLREGVILAAPSPSFPRDGAGRNAARTAPEKMRAFVPAFSGVGPAQGRAAIVAAEAWIEAEKAGQVQPKPNFSLGTGPWVIFLRNVVSMTALPITSAGRFSPLGPRAMTS